MKVLTEPFSEVLIKKFSSCKHVKVLFWYSPFCKNSHDASQRHPLKKQNRNFARAIIFSFMEEWKWNFSPFVQPLLACLMDLSNHFSKWLLHIYCFLFTPLKRCQGFMSHSSFGGSYWFHGLVKNNIPIHFCLLKKEKLLPMFNKSNLFFLSFFTKITLTMKPKLSCIYPNFHH